jgi:hypothetical protein
MRVNSTVALTLVLLTLMLGAGLTSTIWGYSLGRDSLKGVTQPNTRPINNSDGDENHLRREELVFLKEEDILANVKAQIEGGGVAPADVAPASP